MIRYQARLYIFFSFYCPKYSSKGRRIIQSITEAYSEVISISISKCFVSPRICSRNNGAQVSGQIFPPDLQALLICNDVSVYYLLRGTYLRLCSVCRITSSWGCKNTSNVWWMAPVKPRGLQISYNVIPLLVWFPSMTLCEEQSATFSKTHCQGSNILKVGKKKKINTDWSNMTPKETFSKAVPLENATYSNERLLQGVYHMPLQRSAIKWQHDSFSLMQSLQALQEKQNTLRMRS